MHDTASGTTDARDTNPDWVTRSVPDVAKLLGISERNAWYLVHSGRLPSLQLGRRRLVRRVDLDQFLADLAAEQNALRESVSAA